VSRKTQAVLREGLTAVVCVGEKERDEGGDFFATLREQIKASFARVQRRFITDVIVAYEPLWAIGKNWREAARPEDVREAAIFIRKTLADIFGEQGVQVPVLYGGSVGPENIDALLAGADVSGFLVGHESLDSETFSFLIKLANDA
jgi:triosephosphate isomerase